MSEPIQDATSQLSELVCYLVNLADDLQKWIAEGTVPQEVLSEVSDDLRDAAVALDTGATVSAIPSISLPPQRHATSSRRHSPESLMDDEIPF